MSGKGNLSPGEEEALTWDGGSSSFLDSHYILSAQKPEAGANFMQMVNLPYVVGKLQDPQGKVYQTELAGSSPEMMKLSLRWKSGKKVKIRKVREPEARFIL